MARIGTPSIASTSSCPWFLCIPDSISCPDRHSGRALEPQKPHLIVQKPRKMQSLNVRCASKTWILISRLASAVIKFAGSVGIISSGTSISDALIAEGFTRTSLSKTIATEESDHKRRIEQKEDGNPICSDRTSDFAELVPDERDDEQPTTPLNNNGPVLSQTVQHSTIARRPGYIGGNAFSDNEVTNNHYIEVTNNWYTIQVDGKGVVVAGAALSYSEPVMPLFSGTKLALPGDPELLQTKSAELKIFSVYVECGNEATTYPPKVKHYYEPGSPAPRTFRHHGSFIANTLALSSTTGNRFSARPRISRHVLSQIRKERAGIVSQVQYNDFIERKCEQARKIERFSNECMEWALGVHAGLLGGEDRVSSSISSIIKDLLQIGYHPRDLQDAKECMHKALDRWASLSSDYVTPIVLDWDSMAPFIKSAILDVSTVQSANKMFLASRRQFVKKALFEYQQSLPASTWQCYPPFYDTLNNGWGFKDPTDWNEWPELRDIVHQERFGTVEARKEALKDMPLIASSSAERWKHSVESELGELVSGIDLATAIFTLPDYARKTGPVRRTFIGSAEVLRAWNSNALGPEDRDELWQLHDEGQYAARSLIILAGLDPLTLLASDFDKLDLRFVHHFIRQGHYTPQWGLLTPEFTPYVKTRGSFRHIKAWSCSHCSAYFDAPDYHPAVVAHVKTLYGKFSLSHQLHPVLDVDYIRLLTPEPSSLVYARCNVSAEYCCTRCPDRASPRTLSFQGLKSHLKSKHGKIMICHEDWYKPKMILRTWAEGEVINAL
ncbi:hypothetical protein C8J56DRAFT_902441 [Mycena floridula]|nr:hypothetical protein C8J56DRAFT_902441 [Mycena floridula]